MPQQFLIKNITLVNEGQVFVTDILLAEGLIQRIGDISSSANSVKIDGTNKYAFPGIIDSQVHFREPGLTYKGDLFSESKAAVAGGVTSFIDMPNTLPNVHSLEALAEKYALAADNSLANFGFFMGVNGENIDTLLRMDTSQFIGVSDDGL